MTEIHETELPGIGVRQEFSTAGGSRIGVLTTRSGRRELLLYDEDDVDACRAVVHLEKEDSVVLADLLGTSLVADPAASLQRLEGLAIDWLTVATASPSRWTAPSPDCSPLPTGPWWQASSMRSSSASSPGGTRRSCRRRTATGSHRCASSSPRPGHGGWEWARR